MIESKTFQLEVFNGKTYTPHMRASDPRASESLADLGRTTAKPWRVVLLEKAWPAKPRYRRGATCRPLSVTDGSNARMRRTVNEYLDWAEAKGLQTITVFRDSYACQARGRFALRVVDVADFLGEAPQPEMEG